MSDAHDRWIRRLRTTWPEGVPAQEPAALEPGVSGPVEPWPETWRDEMVKQCLHCLYYVELSGDLGADWGACTNELSQYDGDLVFEHWTCREWSEERDPAEEDQATDT
jgi:hypothetical protein